MVLSKKHIDWLDFGIFHGSCLFVCAFSYEESLAHFKKRKTPTGWVTAFKETKDLWEEDSWGFVSKRDVDGKMYFILVLKNSFDFKDESHAQLAHEVLHLATFHIKDFLDPITENEAFCYTHTHLMMQCYKILRS